MQPIWRMQSISKRPNRPIHNEGHYSTADFSRPLAQGGTRLRILALIISIIAHQLSYFKYNQVKGVKGGIGV
jgi:hypothetical protein